MSEETVLEIIIKAVSDPAFRELLFSDPNKALDGFELTEEEVETLKQIDKGSFDANISELEERVSRSSNIGGVGGVGGVAQQQYPYEGSSLQERLLQFLKPPSPPKILG